MKLRTLLLTGLAAMGGVSASAQEAQTVNVFKPHWYVQAQAGAQETLGEISFGDLISPNAQLGFGYNINKVVGARFSVNAWQSKGGQKVNTTPYTWKWNYVAPMVDATFNLSNLFCGFNPNRVVNLGVFGGLGANVAWGNSEAADAQKAIVGLHSPEEQKHLKAPLEYLWSDADGGGTKARLVARVGANVDFRVSDRVSLGLELSANTLSDRYNSKKADNPDWYFNGLVGIKVALGKTYTTKTVEAPKPVERIVERVVEKLVPTPVETKKEEAVEKFRRDIFFQIGNSTVAKSQLSKINEIVLYMKENPTATLNVTGYADKGTGNNAINDRIAARRAQVVYNLLVKKGIERGRIMMGSKGSRVQPFEENDKNRVTICISD